MDDAHQPNMGNNGGITNDNNVSDTDFVCVEQSMYIVIQWNVCTTFAFCLIIPYFNQSCWYRFLLISIKINTVIWFKSLIHCVIISESNI